LKEFEIGGGVYPPPLFYSIAKFFGKPVFIKNA